MFDIISFARDYGIDFTTKGKNVGPGWVGLQCPYHIDDGYHLGFNLDGGYLYCWKCGGHKLSEAIMEYVKCSASEAYRLVEKYSIRFAILERLNTVHASSLTLPGEDLTEPYKKYLKKRGFSPEEIIQKYGVRCGGILGDWKYRLIIPIFYKGALISYQGRDITGKSDLRYKTLSVEKSIDDPKRYLYNMDNAAGDSILVCEGVTDVWKLGDSAVATLGTSVTEQQVQKLGKYRNVFIVFDPEELAQMRARKLGEKVSALGRNVEIVDTGLDHDPGDMTPQEVENLRKELGV